MEISSSKDRVLLIEDNATTARSITLFLEAAGFVCATADCGQAGLDRLAQAEVDLIVLDLNLPDIDGLRVCRMIRQGNTVPILMLTARSAEEDIVEGLESGAQDYVCKPFGAKELIARVRRVLRDTSKAPEARQIHCADLVLDKDRRTLSQAGKTVALTRSEFDVLLVLMNRPGWVFTRAQLIHLALGEDYDGFDRTIDTHIWSIRRKLGGNQSGHKYIFSEPGIGYRFTDGR